VSDWYDEAEAYDIVYDTDTEADVRGLLGVMSRWGRRPLRRVLEPACGSGRLVRALARRGLRVTGFDRNPHMVAYARRRNREAGLRARVVEADMVDFGLGRGYDLAHCLISSFQHLGRERDARAHLARVADAVAPGGLYVLALHRADYEDPGASKESWGGRRDGQTVDVRLESGPVDPRRRRMRMDLRLAGNRGGRRWERRDRWWFRTYDDAQLERLLRSEPRWETARFLDFDFRPDPDRRGRLDTVIVLRRRG